MVVGLDMAVLPTVPLRRRIKFFREMCMCVCACVYVHVYIATPTTTPDMTRWESESQAAR